MKKYRKKVDLEVVAEQWFPGRWVAGVKEFSSGRGACLQTPGGHYEVCAGDWIVTRSPGDKRVCKPDVFEASYEPVELAEKNKEVHNMDKIAGRQIEPVPVGQAKENGISFYAPRDEGVDRCPFGKAGRCTWLPAAGRVVALGQHGKCLGFDGFYGASDGGDGVDCKVDVFIREKIRAAVITGTEVPEVVALKDKAAAIRELPIASYIARIQGSPEMEGERCERSGIEDIAEDCGEAGDELPGS